MKLLSHASIVAALALVSACRSAWYPYRFAPAPLEVSLDTPRAPDAKGRALVTVLGIRREDHGAHRPDQVEVRMRVENSGARKLTIHRDSFRLVTATMEDLGEPFVVGLERDDLATGESAVFDVHFGLTSGKKPSELGIDGLNLKFEVDFEGELVGTGITFERRDEPYPYYWHDPFYGPFYDPWCVHTHVGVVGHARDD